jgi:hypothetical protein
MSKMADKENDNGTTTVRISKAHNAKLGKLCKQFGLSRQEFLEQSVMYFSRPGKDPRQGSDEAMLERLANLEQTLKRFQSDWHASKNTWEKNYLRPGSQADVQLYTMLEKLTNSEKGTGVEDNTELMGMLMIMLSMGNAGIGNEEASMKNFIAQLSVVTGLQPNKIDLIRLREIGVKFKNFLIESKQKKG